jgi:hypothetical protein
MYDTAMPVMWTGSHPRQRRRLAIRPTAPAPNDRMPSTKRCVFAGHRRMEGGHGKGNHHEVPVIDGPSIRMARLGVDMAPIPATVQTRPAATCTATILRNIGEADGIGMPSTTTPWSVTEPDPE